MKDSSVRLLRVNIRNFKNVVCGDIAFINPSKKGYQASVLGLYGQNGSGKTALIDAVQLLRYVMCGESISLEFADYINVCAAHASLRYDFDLRIGEERYTVTYEFRIKKEQAIQETLPIGRDDGEQFTLTIFDEVLRCSQDGEGACEVVMDSRVEDCVAWMGNEFATDLTVAKKIALRSSMSLLFSGDFRSILRKGWAKGGISPELQLQAKIIERLTAYAACELFVLSTISLNVLSSNKLYSAAKPFRKNAPTMTLLPLIMNDSFPIYRQQIQFMMIIIKSMNIVLSQLVPGLELVVKELGPSVARNGDEEVRVQLMSRRDGRDIPFRYESEGIKKIISVLQLLIAVYNQESVTVAIDELDSGVFEYLLGEILKIISEKGRGQLIFTSHNLRPLETLDKGFVAFTTINPSNRYTRINGMKENQNLRDFYFRDIVLGGQDEPLYKPTNNAEIALAFREAWEAWGDGK